MSDKYQPLTAFYLPGSPGKRHHLSPEDSVCRRLRRKETIMKSAYEDLVAPFYQQALTVNRETTSTVVLERVLAEGFRSVNGQEVKDKGTLTRQVESFWKLIPDLRWEPKEGVVEGNRIVVRCVASGSPRGSFLGMQLDGSKSFRIDTIDIHTIENDRIVEVYHLEDWATAIRQLKG